MKKLSNEEMRIVEGGKYCRTTIHKERYNFNLMWHDSHWDEQACQTKTVKGYCVLWRYYW